MEKMTCVYCGENEPIMSQSGPHLKATCSICNRFIKFVTQNKEMDIMPFGKYKGIRFEHITDSEYLNWMLQNLKSPECKFKNPAKLIRSIEKRLFG
jgi:uncharacterized protein (DUF3820 family)